MKRSFPKLKVNATLLNLLIWVGALLMVAGLSAGAIAGNWSTVPLGLLMGGAVLLAVGFLLRWQFAPQKSESWWRRRSVQTSTNAIIVTLAVMAILGVINFLAVRYPARVDFTENKLFSLASQSKQVVQGIKDPLKVLVFDSNPDPQSRTLLQQYQQVNPEAFSFEFVDPQAQPNLTLQYEIRNAGDIVLEMGDRTKKLDAPLSEAKLTPAVASLGSPRQTLAYFIQGHGELALGGDQNSLSQAVKAMEQEGITVNTLNLAVQEQVPPDADLLIVAGPQRPFLPSEVEVLTQYLKQEGNLLMLLDPDTQLGLESLLKAQGVELDSRLVIDQSSSTPAWPLVVDYGDHPITKAFRGQISFFPEARAILTPDQANANLTVLLMTSDVSWAEANPKGDDLKPDPKRDLQGPLNLGVAISTPLEAPKAEAKSSQPAAETADAKPPQPDSEPADTQSPPPAAEPKESRLVIIGDSDFAKTAFFSEELNGDLFLNAVNWLARDRDDPTLSIRPKEPKNRRLELSPEKGRLLSWLGLGLLPLGAFGAAAALWWQRR